jgi:hypothetical protein
MFTNLVDKMQPAGDGSWGLAMRALSVTVAFQFQSLGVEDHGSALVLTEKKYLSRGVFFHVSSRVYSGPQ